METVPRVMRAIREEARRRGAAFLSIPQLRTLAFLHRRPGACLFHLAEHLGVSRPTASTLVDRMVRRGMLTRTPDPQERRRIVLNPTPLGVRHYLHTRQSTQVWMAAMLARLSPDALRRISQGISLLDEALNATDGEVPQPRGAAATPRNGRTDKPAPSEAGQPATAGRNHRSRAGAKGQGGLA